MCLIFCVIIDNYLILLIHGTVCEVFVIVCTASVSLVVRCLHPHRLCERLFDLAKVGSVGITTGEAFCGVVGSKTRKEYTVLVGVLLFFKPFLLSGV